MSEENNFLLGNGERLTENVYIRKSGGEKNPPYDFNTAKLQVSKWLRESNEDFSSFSDDACPDDQVTGIITMHPRFISKSEFPIDLIKSVGLRAVGGKSRKIKPRNWGIKKPPLEAITDEIFVMGSRKDFQKWSENIEYWDEEDKLSSHLSHFEGLGAYNPYDKIRYLPEKRGEFALEVVLHDIDKKSIDAFLSYTKKYELEPVVSRLRFTKDLAFIPVYANKNSSIKLAEFSHVRVIRGMPSLRQLKPNTETDQKYFEVKLPMESEIDTNIKVAIFDGGIPENSPVDKWVNKIEPQNIGKPLLELQEHGLGVTSALLFGPLKLNDVNSRPICKVDHIRVLDEKTGIDDFDYYDVLERILETLDKAKYDFINLSLGPDIPIDDDEVTRWTASLDERFSGVDILTTVAAGNSGHLDSESGLNRIQPPSDAVNVLSVGAYEREGISWRRVFYSSIGPGRCPGIVKPDGLAFGGSDEEPFYILTPDKNSLAYGDKGTSLAAPNLLRTAISVRSQLGEEFKALAIRALLVHRAEDNSGELKEIGWGRFEEDINKLITCKDDEALVVFKGELPVKEHLRAEIPLPNIDIPGMVTVTATLVIAPDVDPSYPNIYTRGGLEVVFRPDVDKYKHNEDGTLANHPESKSFFSQKDIYNPAEYELRDKAHKWEPCLRASKRFRGSSLNKPFFDIYYHNREQGMAMSEPKPISYALVVSVKAPRVQNFYEQVVRAYANVLIPLRPKTRIQLKF